MADVFVSYSRRDDAFVGELREALRARGKDVWVDVEGIRDAEVFPAAIRSAIEASEAFAFVISPDSVESPFCEQEIRHAVDSHKLIVPCSTARCSTRRSRTRSASATGSRSTATSTARWIASSRRWTPTSIGCTTTRAGC
jgi:hypothetical protein